MKPNPLTELKHGKLITKQNYPTFVETFNSTVQRVENIKGDADVDQANGKITVDNTSYEHPVIRLTQNLIDDIYDTEHLPWHVDPITLSVERAYCQVGCRQFDSNIQHALSVGEKGLSSDFAPQYCIIDLSSHTAELSSQPANNYRYASFKMFRKREDDGKIEYYCLNPVAPAWELYYDDVIEPLSAE